MFEWVWQPSRLVYFCGTVGVGAVFRPAYPSGKWRWHLWVNGRQVRDEGRGASEAEARNAVETRFAEFLVRAGLTSSVGGGVPP